MSGPGEASHLEVVAVAVVILQGLVVDHVDDRDDEGEGVFLDPGQERLQPAGVALAVAVQVEDDVPGGGPGPGQASSDQTFPLAQSHQLHLAGQEPVDVSLQLALQVGLVTEIIHQDDLLHQVLGGSVEDGPDGPDQRGPGLVGEDDDDGGGGEVGVVLNRLTPHVPGVGHLPRVGDLVAHDQIEGLGLHDVLSKLRLPPLEDHGLPHLPQPGHHLGLVLRELAVRPGDLLRPEQIGSSHRRPVN